MTAAKILRRPTLARVAVLVAALVVGMLLLAGPASAKYVRPYEKSFEARPDFIEAIAVDNSAGPSAGDLYVAGGLAPYTSNSISKFDENGVSVGVEITGAETPQGSFEFAPSYEVGSGLAVDGSSGADTGDLYVADSRHGVVDRFDEEGKFLCQITGKVPTTAAEVEAECAGALGSKVTGAAFSPNGVAVNPVNGDVYVSDASSAVIDKFNSKGEYFGQLAGPGITQPGSIAFDSSGELYVANGTGEAPEGVVKLDAGGAFVEAIDSSASKVAVDPADNHVYVYRVEGEEGEGQAAEYDSAGNLVTRFGREQGAISYGSVAASSSTGKAYLTTFFTEGRIYGPGIIIPDVSTAAATEVEETIATLSGEVDPAGGADVESCQFEYGETTAYGQTAPCSPATPYASPAAVSAALSALSPTTTYHFRLAAANKNGVSAYSEDGEFRTKGAPTVESESASEITRFTATLGGEVNPNGYDTEYQIEYVDAQHYENEGGFASPATESTPIPAEDIGSSQTPLSVSQEIENLSIGTTYHYRIAASSSASAGPVSGPDQSFQTQPVAAIEDLGVEARIFSASVEAEVNPLGLDTACQVQYVLAAQFQESGYAAATTLPCSPEDLGSGSSAKRAMAKLHGLQIDSTYHYRFLATNASGTLPGPDREFATFGIRSFSVEALNEAGEPETQAGGHPFRLVTTVRINSNQIAGEESPDVIVKDILAALPPGLIGNPTALPTCTGHEAEEKTCSPDAQVGVLNVAFGGQEAERVPLFNVVPPQGRAARFAAQVSLSTDAYIDSSLRTGGDYGITSGSHNITQLANLTGVTVTLWGVPANPGHDPQRVCPGPEGYSERGCPSTDPERPFLSMPTSCTGLELGVQATADSYQAPGLFVTKISELPAITGCNKVQFEPTIQARPTTNVADSPSGLHVDIHVPQNEAPAGTRTADLKDAKVSLPKGLIVNPSGANGLQGCSAAQFDIHGEEPAACPDASKIGTVQVDSPLVDHPLQGSVYLAKPFDNPFDSLLAIYVGVSDPETGVVIKLAGHVRSDPQSGQLTTTFNDNPQLPFEDFRLDFFNGAKAPLRTPAVCGEYKTTSELTPWSAPESGPPAEPSDSYEISAGPNGHACAHGEAEEPNKPSFEAGTASPLAGAYSPFSLHLHREDGSQNFSALNVSLPPGLIGKLAGVGECSDGQLAAAAQKTGAEEQAALSCPAASRIGTVNIGAGAGPSPYYVSGTAYLAGPYKGAPLSIAIITPAVAGPFDLGTVVVRNALYVNSETAQISARSDPIPTQLQGIQLDVRSIDLNIDRNQFTLNPTSCDPMAFSGEAISSLGQAAPLSSPFQVGECGRLAFQPKLSLKLSGKTKRTGHPALRAVLTYPRGAYANIARARVTLPHAEFLDQSHIGTVCTRVQFAANACPAASIYGHARAITPLLDQPIEGPVYLRSSSHKLPDLVADLNGQIEVDLAGKVDTGKGGGIRNTFEVVPDAPVSKFVLSLKGGDRGLLVNSENICKKPQKALAHFVAQNGKISDTTPLISNDCKPGEGKRKGHSHH